MSTKTQFEFNVEFVGQYAQFPARMQEAIRRYVVQGVEPGDFLVAVITNDLRRAIFCADEENLPLLQLYVTWFYNEAPGACYGSRENMREWINARSQDEFNS